LALIAKNKTVVDEGLLPELQSIPMESVLENDLPVVDSIDDLSSGDLPEIPAE
jgi:hypothetical protein